MVEERGIEEKTEKGGAGWNKKLIVGEEKDGRKIDSGGRERLEKK